MRTGDRVKVYPHGAPELSSPGHVALISANQLSIAVGFLEKPPFAIVPDGMAVHPEHGLMLLAMREQLHGEPWGPWIEMFSGGHFEIEEPSHE